MLLYLFFFTPPVLRTILDQQQHGKHHLILFRSADLVRLLPLSYQAVNEVIEK